MCLPFLYIWYLFIYCWFSWHSNLKINEMIISPLTGVSVSQLLCFFFNFLILIFATERTPPLPLMSFNAGDNELLEFFLQLTGSVWSHHLNMPRPRPRPRPPRGIELELLCLCNIRVKSRNKIIEILLNINQPKYFISWPWPDLSVE